MQPLIVHMNLNNLMGPATSSSLSSCISPDKQASTTTLAAVSLSPCTATALKSNAAAALCRRMCPPSACPVGNTAAQVVHRCTSVAAAPLPGRAPRRRSRPCARTSGRLWLVRCPPSAWNVGNARPHVLHRNAPPPARCCCCWWLQMTPPCCFFAITLLAVVDSDRYSRSSWVWLLAVAVGRSVVVVAMSGRRSTDFPRRRWS